MTNEHQDGKFVVRRIDGRPFLEDEPLSVFRAHDVALPAVLRTYETLCAALGSPLEHVYEIRAQREKIEAWQERYGTKVPD